MGTVQKLADKVKEGLQTALPKLRKTVIKLQTDQPLPAFIGEIMRN
jgi:hypothetical protein